MICYKTEDGIRVCADDGIYRVDVMDSKGKRVTVSCDEDLQGALNIIRCSDVYKSGDMVEMKMPVVKK